MPYKSLDVRAKRRLCFGVLSLTWSCVTPVSRHVISIARHRFQIKCMKKIIISSFLFLVLTASGCAQTKSLSNLSVAPSNQETADGSTIDQKKAREFSDSVVKAIIEDRQNDLRQKMEQAFQDYYSENDMKPLAEQVYSAYGKPLNVEFKKDEVGYKIYDTGERKPMRKFWYALETTKQDKEQKFLFTEIVSNGDGLACAGFSIVTFSQGIPPDLR